MTDKKSSANFLTPEPNGQDIWLQNKLETKRVRVTTISLIRLYEIHKKYNIISFGLIMLTRVGLTYLDADVVLWSANFYYKNKTHTT